MLENGYIKIQRCLKKWRWYTDKNVKCLWLHLLLSANYEANEFREITVQRGQLVTSIKSLSDETGLTVKEVRTALDKLKKTGEITVLSNRHSTLIDIVNFDIYQSDDIENVEYLELERQTVGKQRANQRQTVGKQRATMEESKEITTHLLRRDNIYNNNIKQEKEKEPDFLETLSERFSENLLAAVKDWLAYKTERREAYKPMGLKSLLTEIENRASKHGEQAVCDVIRLSMSNGWRGIIWDRIQQNTAGGNYSYDDDEGSL